MENFYIDDFIIFYTANLFNLLTPGANFAIITCHSSTISRKAGMMTIIGIVSSAFISKGCAICAIGFITTKLFWCFQLVKYMGCMYLFYLGIGYLWHSITMKTVQKKLDAIVFDKALSKSSMQYIPIFRIGFLTDMFNPQALFGFMTIVSSTLHPETTFLIRLCYVLILICTSFIWYTCMVFLFSHPMLTKKLYSFFPWIRWLSGISLIGIAFKILFIG
ncbi:LysE family translocator [Candidatus Cardinium hertigii]|uniref:LysE family translocator n=1 Tax=Candidatus Cardinium hertigii TaxID=247481 RepID=UPI003D7E8521